MKKHICDETLALVDKYRKKGEQTSGSKKALRLYRRGISIALKGNAIDNKNYAYYYEYQEHCEEYEKKGQRLFEKAADLFRRSAELGNELAMMNYALYLFDFQNNPSEALRWFKAASECGLAVADYQLSAFYKDGLCGVECDKTQAALYFSRYRERCATSERQRILALNLKEDYVINRFEMYRWFCGYSTPLIYDTPSAKPPRWKY